MGTKKGSMPKKMLREDYEVIGLSNKGIVIVGEQFSKSKQALDFANKEFLNPKVYSIEVVHHIFYKAKDE